MQGRSITCYRGLLSSRSVTISRLSLRSHAALASIRRADASASLTMTASSAGVTSRWPLRMLWMRLTDILGNGSGRSEPGDGVPASFTTATKRVAQPCPGPPISSAAWRKRTDRGFRFLFNITKATLRDNQSNQTPAWPMMIVSLAVLSTTWARSVSSGHRSLHNLPLCALNHRDRVEP